MSKLVGPERKNPVLTQEELKAQLSYSPETGLFSRIGKPNHKVGVRTEHGYIIIQVDRVSYRAHRLAWLYMTGHLPEEQIDHINGIRDDNRFANLRLASANENQWNMKPKKSACPAKGVSMAYGKFRASIKVNCKSINLGLYETMDEAAHAYNKAAIKYFGEFARLNPIGVDK